MREMSKLESSENKYTKSMSESSTPDDSSQRACVGGSRQDSQDGMDSLDAT
jgi:hypothetical protein